VDTLGTADVMQVCRQGHVVTERLRSQPDTGYSHCPRCGSQTLCRCLTCGTELAGTAPLPGLVPIGELRPPKYCGGCGAPFPWVPPASAPLSAVSEAVAVETALRRMPRAARVLRDRPVGRPRLGIEDERDLEDLLRAVLLLTAEEVRPVTRTPRYAAGNRTDFVLPREEVAVTAKCWHGGLTEESLLSQLDEDAEFHQGLVTRLIVYLHDPRCVLPDPRGIEARLSRELPGFCLQVVVGQ
jgi:hypothetical protein